MNIDLNYYDQYNLYRNINYTGWDKNGYWWINGTIILDDDFYEKHYFTYIKYMSKKNKKRFKKLKLFTLDERRKFAISLLIRYMKEKGINGNQLLLSFGNQDTKIEYILNINKYNLPKNNIPYSYNKSEYEEILSVWNYFRKIYGV